MIAETIKIKANNCGKGYYLRWYADGWHYWLFKGGFETYLTSGEVYSTIGYSSLLIGDIVKITELSAIRGILRAKFIELFTNDGWKPATLDNESWQLGKADRYSVAISFTVSAWLKGSAEIQGDYEVIPPAPPTTPINYGRLYNWYAATDIRGIAPDGWHIPTLDEINTLITQIGGINDGGKLKIAGFDYWDSPNEGATNETGWNAKGGGKRYRDEFLMLFAFLKLNGNWWTSTPVDETPTYANTLILFNTDFYAQTNQSLKIDGLSLRPIKDNSVLESTVTDIDGNVYPCVKIGVQVWMAENLIVTKYKNGDVIPEVTDNTAWAALSTGGRCDYDNDPLNV